METGASWDVTMGDDAEGIVLHRRTATMGDSRVFAASQNGARAGVRVNRSNNRRNSAVCDFQGHGRGIPPIFISSLRCHIGTVALSATWPFDIHAFPFSSIPPALLGRNPVHPKSMGNAHTTFLGRISYISLAEEEETGAGGGGGGGGGGSATDSFDVSRSWMVTRRSSENRGVRQRRPTRFEVGGRRLARRMASEEWRPMGR